MTELGPLVLILLMLVVFWVLLVRPQRMQQKRLASLQESLAVGDRVVLSAGIYATIRSLDEARAEVEIAPGTVVTVARQVLVNRVEESARSEQPGEGGAPGAPGDQV